MNAEPEETIESLQSTDLVSLFSQENGEESEEERRARLTFHLASGDFFNTVATLVGFLEGSLLEHSTENPQLTAQEVRLAQALRKDLMYLNEHYRIEPKNTEHQAI